MMKKLFSRSVWTASAVALCLGAASAWALTVTVQQLVPGVNANGTLNNALGATIPVKANVNTLTGTFHASGKGKVTNQSGAKQEYQNVPVNIPGVQVESSLYTVKKNGKCSVDASGFVIGN